jgi:MFS family permease
MSADRPDAGSRPPRSGWLRVVTNHLLPNMAPWRASRDFRLLLSSGLVTRFGSYFTYVAVPLQIMKLTGSPVAVGLVGLVELVPMIVFGLWGGALADAVNRRLLIVGTEVGLSLLAILLLGNALLPHPQLWLLYVVAGLTASLDSMQRPALDALIPQIVHHDDLAAASALDTLRKQTAAIVSPALAGLTVASLGLPVAYLVDLASFVVSLLFLLRIQTIPLPDGGEPPTLAAIASGVRYAWSRKDLLGSYVVDLIAMAFAFPTAIFPFLAEQLQAPWALGMLYSSSAVGAVVVSMTSGWYSRVHRHGRAVLLAAALTGVGVLAAGSTHNLWLVLFFLAVSGGADTVSGLGRDTMWNQSIPDELRGRMAGVELLSYSIGPRLGDVRSGFAAARWGALGSMWTGGAACVVGIAALAVALPKMLAYDARTDTNAVAMRTRRVTARTDAVAAQPD